MCLKSLCKSLQQYFDVVDELIYSQECYVVKGGVEVVGALMTTVLLGPLW